MNGSQCVGQGFESSLLPERRKMMQAWADYLDGLREGANVVQIRRASQMKDRFRQLMADLPFTVPNWSVQSGDSRILAV
jgi:hypothetical protein